MIDKKDYIAAFSKVTASENTRQEIMNMENGKSRKHCITGRRVAVLAAVIIMLMTMTLTAFAEEDIALWFRTFFTARSEEQLTDQQISYIHDNEQVISQGSTQDGWTVEMLSALHDDAAGYLIFRVTGPEDAVLEPEEKTSDGNIIFGNFSSKHFHKNRPDLLKASDGVSFGNWGFQWVEDGDGKENTRNFVIHIAPTITKAGVDPFGVEAEYYVHIENIVRETVDMQVLKQLQLKKQKEKADLEYTDEELDQIYGEEILAQGTWDFTVSFSDSTSSSAEEYVEMLTEPIGTDCMISRNEDGELRETLGRLQLYSVKMRHLSVSFYYGALDGYPNLSMYVKATDSKGTGCTPVELGEFTPSVVLKDGTEIPLLYYGFGSGECLTLEAKAPIVFEEVDHIRMADGTIIPMPEVE